jgi:hypothetical protein
VVVLDGTTTVVFAGGLAGTTTVVFAGGFGSLLLMQPESSAAATKKQDAIFIRPPKCSCSIHDWRPWWVQMQIAESGPWRISL